MAQGSPPIWPEDDNMSDRILEQINYLPPPPAANKQDGRSLRPLITIFLPHGKQQWSVDLGRKQFKDCPVSDCQLTDHRSQSGTADVIIFRNQFFGQPKERPPNQLWIFYTLESPKNTLPLGQFGGGQVNWTATFRSDSDIVAPYAKWVPWGKRRQSNPHSPPQVDYATNKTKQVAWFVSNCATENLRYQYAIELAKYIDVDIYGACAKTPIGPCFKTEPDCWNMLKRDYRFYLSFENTNCKEYISEKFFFNALENDVIPVAMGAPLKDYHRLAPPKSFIHVEQFSSPKELAEFLKILAKDSQAYNSYFHWKHQGRFIDTKFWCRLCALLHNGSKVKFYHDLDAWWRASSTCGVPVWFPDS